MGRRRCRRISSDSQFRVPLSPRIALSCCIQTLLCTQMLFMQPE